VAKITAFYVKLFCDFANQKLSKSVNVSRSYSKNKSGTGFLRHGVVAKLCVSTSMFSTPRPRCYWTETEPLFISLVTGN